MPSMVGCVPVGDVSVGWLISGAVGEESLQERRILGDEGFVALTVVIEPSTRTIVRPVHLSARGFSDDPAAFDEDRKSTRLNSSHDNISYAVFCFYNTPRYSTASHCV